MKRIFSRITGRHLDDAAIAALWTSATSTGAASVSGTPSDPHVASCGECRVRYDAFASWMDEVATIARAEADDVFTVERLAVQQAAVLRRLEANERPARVIAFPTLSPASPVRSTPVRRWIAAAAAAGLLVGVGLGQLMDLRHNPRIFPVPRTVQPPRVEATARPTPAAASVSDPEETLLRELEAAATPQYEALRAFDTLTPRAADFLTSSR